jgi:hypothetical protein
VDTVTRGHLAGLEMARECVGNCNSETTAWDKCDELDELIAEAMKAEPTTADGKVAVTGEALRTVLNALVNAPHQIRELQVTREPVELFADNPINVLIAEYEAAHAAPAAGGRVEQVCGWIATAKRLPIEWEDPDGAVEVQVSDGTETGTAVFFKKSGSMGWKRLEFSSVKFWQPLAAAPKEQGQ